VLRQQRNKDESLEVPIENTSISNSIEYLKENPSKEDKAYLYIPHNRDHHITFAYRTIVGMVSGLDMRRTEN
jgi:hypothetical protein